MKEKSESISFMRKKVWHVIDASSSSRCHYEDPQWRHAWRGGSSGELFPPASSWRSIDRRKKKLFYFVWVCGKSLKYMYAFFFTHDIPHGLSDVAGWTTKVAEESRRWVEFMCTCCLGSSSRRGCARVSSRLKHLPTQPPLLLVLHIAKWITRYGTRARRIPYLESSF